MDQNVKTLEEENKEEDNIEPIKDEDNNLTSVMTFLQLTIEKVRGNKSVKKKKEEEKKGFVQNHN
jgi:hypothetical protein